MITDLLKQLFESNGDYDTIFEELPNGGFQMKVVPRLEDLTKLVDDFKAYAEEVPDCIWEKSAEIFNKHSQIKLSDFSHMLDNPTHETADVLKASMDLYKHCVKSAVIEHIQELQVKYDI